MLAIRCIACDCMLTAEPREREDYCGECNNIISLLVNDEIEEIIEIPFGLYEDWETAEWEEEDEDG